MQVGANVEKEREKNRRGMPVKVAGDARQGPVLPLIDKLESY